MAFMGLPCPRNNTGIFSEGVKSLLALDNAVKQLKEDIRGSTAKDCKIFFGSFLKADIFCAVQVCNKCKPFHLALLIESKNIFNAQK
jgi:hypothetical protein